MFIFIRIEKVLAAQKETYVFQEPKEEIAKTRSSLDKKEEEFTP